MASRCHRASIAPTSRTLGHRASMEENGGPISYVTTLRSFAERLEHLGWWLSEPAANVAADAPESCSGSCPESSPDSCPEFSTCSAPCLTPCPRPCSSLRAKPLGHLLGAQSVRLRLPAVSSEAFAQVFGRLFLLLFLRTPLRISLSIPLSILQRSRQGLLQELLQELPLEFCLGFLQATSAEYPQPGGRFSPNSSKSNGLRP